MRRAIAGFSALVVVLTLGTGLAGLASAATAAQYRRQADAICRQTKARLAKIPQPTSRSQVAQSLKRGFGYYKQRHARLAGLSPPSSLKALHKKALALDEKQVSLLKNVVLAIAAGIDPQKAYAAASPSLTAWGKAESVTWRKLRVIACATG